MGLEEISPFSSLFGGNLPFFGGNLPFFGGNLPFFLRFILEQGANNCNWLEKWGISLRPRLHRPRWELPENRKRERHISGTTGQLTGQNSLCVLGVLRTQEMSIFFWLSGGCPRVNRLFQEFMCLKLMCLFGGPNVPPPLPTSDFQVTSLVRIFRLQQGLEWRCLLRRTWSGQKLFQLQFPGLSLP